jgi:ABC-2 type transporter.
LRFKDAGSVVSILGNSAPLLGGVFFSVALLPQPLRVLSLAFPFTYGADALRALWLGTVPLFPLRQELGLLGLLAAGYLALGWWALLRFERLARHHGLESF